MFIASGAQRLTRLCTGVSLSRIGSDASHTTTPSLNRILRWYRGHVSCGVTTTHTVQYHRMVDKARPGALAEDSMVVCIAVSAN